MPVEGRTLKNESLAEAGPIFSAENSAHKTAGLPLIFGLAGGADLAADFAAWGAHGMHVHISGASAEILNDFGEVSARSDKGAKMPGPSRLRMN